MFQRMGFSPPDDVAWDPWLFETLFATVQDKKSRVASIAFRYWHPDGPGWDSAAVLGTRCRVLVMTHPGRSGKAVSYRWSQVVACHENSVDTVVFVFDDRGALEIRWKIINSKLSNAGFALYRASLSADGASDALAKARIKAVAAENQAGLRQLEVELPRKMHELVLELRQVREQVLLWSAHPAGLYPDPTKRSQLRYWDGCNWTPHVENEGRHSEDRLNPLEAWDDSVPRNW